jgi:Tol biopolymer transport system component
MLISFVLIVVYIIQTKSFNPSGGVAVAKERRTGNTVLQVIDSATNKAITNAKVLVELEADNNIYFSDTFGKVVFNYSYPDDGVTANITINALGYSEVKQIMRLPPPISDIKIVPLVSTPQVTSIQSDQQAPASINIDQITNNQGNNSAPSFSSDGRKIVYLSDRDGNKEIYTYDFSTKKHLRITNTPNVNEDMPLFHPDSKHIIYGAFDGKQEDIYMCDIDGRNSINLTKTPKINEGRPRISISGKFITYDSDVTADWEIYVGRLVGDGIQNVKLATLRPDFNDRLPSFSPDGRNIVFRSEIFGKGPSTSRLVTYNQDSKAIDDMTKPGASYADWYPSFNPDGRHILFASNRNGTNGIYELNINDKTVRTVFDTRFDENYPLYSPDGTKIVFSSDSDGGKYNIFVIHN